MLISGLSNTVIVVFLESLSNTTLLSLTGLMVIFAVTSNTPVSVGLNLPSSIKPLTTLLFFFTSHSTSVCIPSTSLISRPVSKGLSSFKAYLFSGILISGLLYIVIGIVSDVTVSFWFWPYLNFTSALT